MSALRINPPGELRFVDLGEACGRPRAQGRIPGGVICKPGPTHISAKQRYRELRGDHKRALDRESQRRRRALKKAARAA